MAVLEAIVAARADGDPAALADMVPYARFLGLQVELADAGVQVRMPYAQHLIGNPAVPALHGGAVGSILEMAAVMQVLWSPDVIALPKTINITIDYLRPARPIDTLAFARVTKWGRRVISLDVHAWQEDRERLVATAIVHLLLRKDG